MHDIKRYILDSSVLFSSPDILAQSARRKMFIPESVFDEVTNRAQGANRIRLRELINRASSHGLKIIAAPKRIKQELQPNDINVNYLSNTDIDIARIAINFNEQHSQHAACVMTSDKVLIGLLRSRNVNTISPSEFVALSKDETKDLDIYFKAKSILKLQRIGLILNVIFGLVFGVIFSFLLKHYPKVVQTISIWGILVVMPAAGVILFWVRQWFRKCYGTIEFVFGLFLTYRMIIPQFECGKIHITEGIQVLGALYVMVRGLDNFGKGIKGTSFELFWKHFFKQAN